MVGGSNVREHRFYWKCVLERSEDSSNFHFLASGVSGYIRCTILQNTNHGRAMLEPATNMDRELSHPQVDMQSSSFITWNDDAAAAAAGRFRQ